MAFSITITLRKVKMAQQIQPSGSPYNLWWQESLCHLNQKCLTIIKLQTWLTVRSSTVCTHLGGHDSKSASCMVEKKQFLSIPSGAQSVQIENNITDADF